MPDLGRAEESWGWLLGELGFDLSRRWDRGVVWRQNGTGIVIEQSPDMVPGMLHSRLRPGMNHIAFNVDSAEEVARLLVDGAEHGWRPLDHATPTRCPMPSWPATWRTATGSRSSSSLRGPSTTSVDPGTGPVRPTHPYAGSRGPHARGLTTRERP